MSTTAAKIKEIEDEMAKTQKNKATSYHLGQLRAKLAKLKRELITPSSSGGGGGAGFDVARTGIATVGFVGFPSVGKSTLMSGMTGQDSLAAAYEFTTLTTVPGELAQRCNDGRVPLLIRSLLLSFFCCCRCPRSQAPSRTAAPQSRSSTCPESSKEPRTAKVEDDKSLP